MNGHKEKHLWKNEYDCQGNRDVGNEQLCRPDTGEETQELNSGPATSLSSAFFKRLFRHTEDPLNNKIQKHNKF